MSNYRSHKRNYFVLLALMLLLPISGAFAFNSTFDVTVVDEGGSPVSGVEVYVWDKLDPNNNGGSPVLTDQYGVATVTLPNQSASADSLTNPTPNVGFLALPDITNNSANLAFGLHEMVFYNLFAADATGPSVEITLHPGCLVHVKPQINDGTTVAAGLKSGMQIYLPGVPWQVKGFYVSPTNINSTTPSWDVVWPKNSFVNVELYGDGNWGDHFVPEYYSWKNESFPIGAEAEQDVVIVHDKKAKAAIRVELTEPDPANPVQRMLHFGENKTVYYQGNVDVWFPIGNYNFNFAIAGLELPAGSGFGPPPEQYLDVALTDPTTPVVKQYNINGGVGLTVNMQLGADASDGDESILGDSWVEVQKKMLVGGFANWIPVQDTGGPISTVATASGYDQVKLFQRLSPGIYRLRIWRKNYSDQGVIDFTTAPSLPRCFGYITGPEFEITETEAQTASTRMEYLQLPQVSAVVINLAVQNQPDPTNANNGWAKDLSGNVIPPMLAYAPEAGSEYGSKLYFDNYAVGAPYFRFDPTTGQIFVPFAKGDGSIIVKAGYDEDYSNPENPISHKVWAPVPVVPIYTTSADLTIDLAKFTDVSSTLLVGDTMMPFQGSAVMTMDPLVPLPTTDELPFQKAYGYYGTDNKVFNEFDQNPFIFRLEIGSRFVLSAREDSSGLEGFIPKTQVLTVADPSVDPTANYDMAVDEGSSFSGELTLNGELINDTSLAAKVTVQAIIDYDKGYDSGYYYNIWREAIVNNSQFKVSGLRPGQYEVFINLENFDFYSGNYNGQTMPVIRREIFVGENFTSMTNKIPFDLNTNMIGYVEGKIVDDAGNGIPGLHVELSRKVPQYEGDMHMDYHHYMRGENVFFCTTDAEGRLVQPGSNPNLIPLEAGEYDLFVVGMDTPPTEYTLSFADYMSGPNASVRVFSNNQKTPVYITLQRKYPLSGTITEDGNIAKFLNFQILDEMGRPVGWGYTNELGQYEIREGVVPGNIQFGIIVEAGASRRFYLETRQIAPGQANVVDLALNSQTLDSINMVTKDSSGAILPNAYGDLLLFSNPELGFRAPHWYLTYVESDAMGRMNLFAPQLTEAQASFSYGFRGQEFWQPVVATDSTGVVREFYRTYAPPELKMLSFGTTPTELIWKKPATVVVNAANIPAGRGHKYIGVLLTTEMFRNGPNPEEYYQEPTGTTGDSSGQQARPLFRPLVDGKFVFENVIPGKEYIFVAYEAMDEFYPEELMWAWEFQWRAVFRHLSPRFFVDSAEVVRNETFRSLGNLEVTCSQETGLINNAHDVKIGFTADPFNSVGKIAWPLVINVDDTVLFPIEVPASYSYRIAFEPSADNSLALKYLPRMVDNVIVPVGGTRTFDLVLKSLNKVYGTFQFDGKPMDGQILLIPEGADVNEDYFEPIRIEAMMGNYSAYLAPGYYIGYAMPLMGAPKAIEVLMEPGLDTELNITVSPGVMVWGRVVGPNNPTTGEPMPIFDASLAVMRKPTAQSDLIDGQEFIPYPTMMGDNIVRCGPGGEFYFEVESGVDYYLQAIVPVGFSPGAPKKLSVEGTTQITLDGVAVDSAQGVVITTGIGGMIVGSVNSPAFIEAKPAGNNALMDQFGMMGMIQADAFIPGPDGRYHFTLHGLDPAIPYEITVWPGEPGLAVKRLTNVPVPTDPTANPLAIDLGAGYKVVGQLVDEAGNQLSVANVGVNLAMTLPMETLPTTTTANSRFAIRQSTTVEDPANYSLQDALLQGQWAQTNEYGQFVFNNVPQFLVAFVKTENGFVYENVDYGRARTPNFAPAFDTANVMEVNVVVPVAGKIVGRLIDENGQPIKVGWVEAGQGESWTDTMVNSDGTFALEGLAPGASYMVNVNDVPGRVGVFRMGILVEPGNITDLGPILVAKAVGVNGTLQNFGTVVQNAFPYGVPEGMGLSTIAFDGEHLVTDEELLKGDFMQYIVGENELFFDPFNPPTGDVPFGMFARSGKAHLGMVLHREDQSGVMTLVTWGWQPGLNIPTQEQLGTATYNLGTAIVSPTAFGAIEGTLKHSVDTAAAFNPADALIALYPVDATTGALLKTPFPRAITSPVDGRWFIKNVPAGSYKIKVITRKYGTQFFNRIVTIGTTLAKEDLALGTSVKRVFGKVVLKGGTTPVASAKVNMFLRQLATTTDAEGVFSFYMPVGEYVLPQLEILKPGFEAKRVLEFTGVATEGVRLETDLDLGTIELSDAVGRFEATVKSADGNVALIGAEVALVYKESATSAVWTIGEVQITDESGRVAFTTVPTGRDVTFRARAFYHKPEIYTLTAANNTGNATADIVLQKANPKVFYTGFVSAHETNSSLLNVKAMFDFNQPVYQTRLGLTIADQDRLADADPTDLIGGRLTSMRFINTIPNAETVIATVSYDTANNGTKVGIGEFNMVGGAMFKKEYEVDPLAANGFTARQTDEQGNTLPVGLTVPQGYLDPTIDSFSLTVATPTVDGATLEGTTTPPEFAGPAFEFTFGGDNFGAGSEHEGLFEITIQYEEGTALEPRWYDTTNNRWSKVGIIQDSVRYDYPEAGYVTFKVSHLTKFAILKNVSGAASGLRCDFTGDGQVNDADLIFLLAAVQTKGLAELNIVAYDLATVKSAAGPLYPTGDYTNAILPSEVIDDVNGDGKIGDEDLMILLAYLQTKGLADLGIGSLDSQSVTTTTGTIMPSFKGTVTQMPGELVSR